MNKYDKQRRDQLVKTLTKAKEQAVTAAMHLTVCKRPVEIIYEVYDALEHINIALERLEVSEDEGKGYAGHSALRQPKLQVVDS